ncbi:hypothetical protein [Botrimarina sp.]|uniref:hypothetical protein n=1 Tax=Botrimarina sp. TaxID=2795802 RepID=UPI0032F0572A
MIRSGLFLIAVVSTFAVLPGATRTCQAEEYGYVDERGWIFLNDGPSLTDDYSYAATYFGQIHVAFEGDPRGVLAIENLVTGTTKRVNLAKIVSGEAVYDHYLDETEPFSGSPYPFRFTLSGGNIESLQVGGLPDGNPNYWFEVDGSGHAEAVFTIYPGF